MAAHISQITLRDKTSYAMSKLWPGMDGVSDEQKLRVGPIFYRVAVTITVPIEEEQALLDDDGKPALDENGKPMFEPIEVGEKKVLKPAYYEVWGVSELIFVGFMASFLEQLNQKNLDPEVEKRLNEAVDSGKILRRTISPELVSVVDEVWRADEALREIVSRFSEMRRPADPPAQQPQNGQVQAAAGA